MQVNDIQAGCGSFELIKNLNDENKKTFNDLTTNTIKVTRTEKRQ